MSVAHRPPVVCELPPSISMTPRPTFLPYVYSFRLKVNFNWPNYLNKTDISYRRLYHLSLYSFHIPQLCSCIIIPLFDYLSTRVVSEPGRVSRLLLITYQLGLCGGFGLVRMYHV